MFVVPAIVQEIAEAVGPFAATIAGGQLKVAESGVEPAIAAAAAIDDEVVSLPNTTAHPRVEITTAAEDGSECTMNRTTDLSPVCPPTCFHRCTRLIILGCV